MKLMILLNFISISFWDFWNNIVIAISSCLEQPPRLSVTHTHKQVIAPNVVIDIENHQAGGRDSKYMQAAVLFGLLYPMWSHSDREDPFGPKPVLGSRGPLNINKTFKQKKHIYIYIYIYIKVQMNKHV